jgi:hypothetical protein
MKLLEVQKDFYVKDFIMPLKITSNTSSDDLLYSKEMGSDSYPDILLSRVRTTIRTKLSGTET